MLEIDLVLFQALNADAATLPAVVAVARWVSQQLPTPMGGLLLGSLVLGNAAQRRALALPLASMALAWLGVQLLRLAVPAPRPAQLGIGVQWIEHAARDTSRLEECLDVEWRQKRFGRGRRHDARSWHDCQRTAPNPASGPPSRTHCAARCAAARRPDGGRMRARSCRYR